MQTGLKTILSIASKNERKCKWVEAALLYEDLATASQPSQARELREKMGLCLHRAAFQSRNLDEFRGRMQQSKTAYEEAADQYETISLSTSKANATLCRAMVEFNRYWISRGYEARREALQSCEELQREALRIFHENRDQHDISKSNIALATTLLEQDLLETTWDGRRRRLEEAQVLAERAISILSNKKQTSDLILAYCRASWAYNFGSEVHDSEEEVRQLTRKSIEYAEKASALAEKFKDLYLIGLSNHVAGSAYERLGNISASLVKYERTLENGRKANDNWLVGWALCNISSGMYWEMMVESDPLKRAEGYEKSIRFAEDGARHLLLASSEAGVACSYVHYAESCLTLAQESITPVENAKSLLQKAVDVARTDLQNADESGQPRFRSSVRNCLSKTLYYLATLESDPQRKVALLDEALRLREERMKIASNYFPFRHWERSVDQSSLAMIKSELAKVEENPERKRDLLISAVENMENCMQFCSRAVESVLDPKELMAGIGRNYDIFSRILNQLYQLTQEKNLLERLNQVFRATIDCYAKIGQPARVAEAYWGLGEIHLRSAENAKAREDFLAAADSYRKAATQIRQLRELYDSYASYMEAWSDISAAKGSHEDEEYDKAVEHYEQAAERLSSSRRWSYLSGNYKALAAVEEAEYLSRAENAEQAIEEFRKASHLFGESHQELRARLVQTENPEERESILSLADAASPREKYCEARILLEQAKLLYRKGDVPLSTRQYSSAAGILERVVTALPAEWERKEIEEIISSCRAWEKMQEAETKSSAELYREAAELFTKAHEAAAKQKAAQVARGNASYCMARSASLGFRETWRIDDYMTAKSHLADSADHYSKAGFSTAAEWARATERMLDAYVYINNALKEAEPEKRARNYLAAEKVLELSASMYEKIGYPARRDEVLTILKKVREEREFALSLVEVFTAPTIVSSTTSFSIPTPRREEPVGLSEFQVANVQIVVNLPNEVVAGEEFRVKLDLINTGKKTATLHKIENILPKEFTIADAHATIGEDGNLECRGKRIQPLSIESVSYSAKSNEVGEIEFGPKVYYSDESGKLLTSALTPVRVTTRPPREFKFKAEKTGVLFDHLVSAFVKDYMARKFQPEKSGWRTLVEIARETRTPTSTIYGKKGGIGPILAELVQRGIVETRIFSGERGRGGEVMRLRIAYEREPIREYVNQKIRTKP